MKIGIGDVAVLLGVSVRTVWRRIHRGTFPRGRIENGAMVWTEEEIQNVMSIDPRNALDVRYIDAVPQDISEREYRSAKKTMLKKMRGDDAVMEFHIQEIASLLGKVSKTFGFDDYIVRKRVARKIVVDLLQSEKGCHA